MKEYICKEDLLKDLGFTCVDEYIETEIVNNTIKDFPTVTKADICREFGKEVIKRYRKNPDKGFAIIMSEILEEMH